MSSDAEASSPAETTLELPARPGYHAVARLVLGGIAARCTLPVDRVDDLLLAVDSLLMREVAGDTVQVAATASAAGLTVRVGRFRTAELEDASVRRVVVPLVDTAREVRVDGDDGVWIELAIDVAPGRGA